MKKIKAIAMYLPQFHRTPENDRWWGEGFTEWTAVKKAEPVFIGHLQPREPLDDNYYNLLEKSTMEWQAALAKKYSISGFCFYHYWFEHGRRILEKPAENLLKWNDIDMPFCFSWANESWIRTWSNVTGGNAWAQKFDTEETKKELSTGVLLQQGYGNEYDWREHFDYLLPFFKDERYIKIEGKPVFMIYKPETMMECIDEMLLCWKYWAIEAGLPGLYIIGEQCAPIWTMPWKMVDARNEHGPAICLANEKKVGETTFYDYDFIWERFLNMDKDDGQKTYYCGFTDFDSTPRQAERALIFDKVTPEKFYNYYKRLVQKSLKLEDELVFINAWNEWGEGMHLEPDKKNGYAFLEAVNRVMDDVDEIREDISNHIVKTSVIIPVFNTEQYIRECLDSVLNQTQKEVEIIVVDDGSTDGSLAILREYENRYDNILVYTQENKRQGAARNLGLQYATGEYVYYLDSDDYLDPDALETCYLYAKQFNLEVVLFDAKVFFDGKLADDFKPDSFDRRHIIKDFKRIYTGKEFLSEYMGIYPDTVSPCMIYTSKEFIDKYKMKFIEGVFYEDEEYRLKQMLAATRIMYLPKLLYNRRYRGGSTMTSGFDTKRVDDLIKVIKAMVNNSILYREPGNNIEKEYIKLKLWIFFEKYAQISEQLEQQVEAEKVLSLIWEFFAKFMLPEDMEDLSFLKTYIEQLMRLFPHADLSQDYEWAKNIAVKEYPVFKRKIEPSAKSLSEEEKKQIKRFKNELYNIYNGISSICIFCSGVYGKKMQKELEMRLIDIVYFVDNDENKWDQEYNGIPCVGIDQLIKDKEGMLIIVANKQPDGIVLDLREKGFEFIITKQQIDEKLKNIPAISI